MLTDTSIYDASGTIIAFDRKVVPIEAWTGAVSGRGNIWGIVRTAEMAERFASFDEFITHSARQIEDGHKAAAAAGELIAQNMIEVVVAGWSESRDRAMGFTLNSDDGYIWRDICEGEPSGFTIGPDVDSAVEEWRLHRVGAEPLDYEPAEFDPFKHGLPLMEAQRRSLSDPRYFAGDPMHCVGGAVWCALITKDGVDIEQIHQWPDVVGQPIMPAAVKDGPLPMIAPSFVPKHKAREWFTLKAKGLIDPVTLMPKQMARAA